MRRQVCAGIASFPWALCDLQVQQAAAAALILAPGQQATLLFGAYPAASAAVAPLIDNGIREEDLILDLPYDPTEDALLLNQRLFLPLAPQTH